MIFLLQRTRCFYSSRNNIVRHEFCKLNVLSRSLSSSLWQKKNRDLFFLCRTNHNHKWHFNSFFSSATKFCSSISISISNTRKIFSSSEKPNFSSLFFNHYLINIRRIQKKERVIVLTPFRKNLRKRSLVVDQVENEKWKRFLNRLFGHVIYYGKGWNLFENNQLWTKVRHRQFRNPILLE